MLTLAAGCADDLPEEPTPVVQTEIATFLGQSDAGTAWEIQRVSDAAPVRLESTQRFTEKIPVKGSRLLINFSTALADTAKRPLPVEIRQIAAIPFDTIRPLAKQEYDRLPDPQMKVLSLWQTQGFINLQVTLEYDGNPRGFTIVANPETIGNEVVECRLARTGEEVSPNFVNRKTYGSFFTGEILTDKNQKIKIIN